jgi:cell division protein FtsB
MTISNLTLKRIILSVLALATVSGLSYGAWAGREAYLANSARVASLEASVASGERSLADKAAEASELESQLAQTNEKYGVAVSEKSAAETARAQAEAAKSGAESAKAVAEKSAASSKKSAADASNEAAWQRGLATEANGNLAVCASNEDALFNALYYVDQQRGHNLSAISAMNEVASYLMAESWTAASISMDGAIWYVGKSSDLQPSVDYWLGQIK